MRHRKAKDLIALAMLMQSRADGVSLQEISETFGVGRRTAERMRDAIAEMFPDVEVVDTGERFKRWRLPVGVANRFANFSAGELSALSLARDLLEKEGLRSHAANLLSLERKVLPLATASFRRKLEIDASDLRDAEVICVRPGPSPKINGEHLELIYRSIICCSAIEIEYRFRGNARQARTVVYPYGIILGRRHYLVAYSETVKDFRLYALSNIVILNVLAQQFQKDETFSLREYASRSFGVFQSPPQEIVLRALPEVAGDALDWHFHPTQTFEPQPDGGLIIRFRAGGLLEIAWHLFTWQGNLQVVAPAALSRILAEECERVIRNATSPAAQ